MDIFFYFLFTSRLRGSNFTVQSDKIKIMKTQLSQKLLLLQIIIIVRGLMLDIILIYIVILFILFYEIKRSCICGPFVKLGPDQTRVSLSLFIHHNVDRRKMTCIID